MIIIPVCPKQQFNNTFLLCKKFIQHGMHVQHHPHILCFAENRCIITHKSQLPVYQSDHCVLLTFAHSWMHSKQNTCGQLLGVPSSCSLSDIKHTGHWSVWLDNFSSPESCKLMSPSTSSTSSFSSCVDCQEFESKWDSINATMYILRY